MSALPAVEGLERRRPPGAGVDEAKRASAVADAFCPSPAGGASGFGDLKRHLWRYRQAVQRIRQCVGERGRALVGVEAASSTLVSSSRAAAGSPATWLNMSAMTSAARSGPSAPRPIRVWRTRASRAGMDGVSGVAAAGSAAGASQRPKACCSQPGVLRAAVRRVHRRATRCASLGGTVTRASSRTSHDNPPRWPPRPASPGSAGSPPGRRRVARNSQW